MEQTDVNVSQNTKRDSAVIEIDLGEIIGILIHRLLLIAIVAIGCAIAGFAFSKFVLPEQFKSTTKIYVLDKDGKRAVKREISIGRQNPQYYEVLEGLEPGDKVITSSYDNFGDNDILELQ